MRFWRIGLALTSAVVLFAVGGRTDNRVEANQVVGFVCMVYKTFENPGQYCGYYAIECSSSTIPPCGSKAVPYYDASCSLGKGDCCKPGTNCFALSKAFQPINGIYVQAPVSEKGTKPLEDDYKPKLYDGKILTTLIADIETPTNEFIKAKLFQILCTKKEPGLPQLVIGDGVQVNSAKEADVKIEYDPKAVTFDQKACHIDLAGVKYTVLLNKAVKAGKEPPKD